MANVADILKLVLTHEKSIQIVSMYTHDIIVLLASGAEKCRHCECRFVTVVSGDVTSCDHCAAEDVVVNRCHDYTYKDLQCAEQARRLNEVIDLHLDSDKNVVIQ